MTDVGDDTGYGSQTTFVLPLQGTSGTSYLYMGDRWGNSMGGTVIADGSTADGARLIRWTCGSGANQQFQRRAT